MNTGSRRGNATQLRDPPRLEHPEGSIEAAYERLAAGIVRCAVVDYSAALTGMLRAESRAIRKHHIDMKRSVQRFFESDWYGEICDIDPDAIMTALEERAVRRELKSTEKSLRSALRKYEAKQRKENGKS